jgi:squalene-hopene/tetraprenyl-beta-curcumene cyclase
LAPYRLIFGARALTIFDGQSGYVIRPIAIACPSTQTFAMIRWPLPLSLLLLGFALAARVEAGHAVTPAAWDAAGAAHYLDTRMAWWRGWPKAQRDHGTVCVSCHTALPVALARPALRRELGKPDISDAERQMLGDVAKRVWMWKEVEPFYTDQKVGLPKSSESRSVEAVLNALILVSRDTGGLGGSGGHLGPDTRQAFANMWPLQMQVGDLKGGFPWLTFKLEPWASVTATYWGATLAALAVARAPDDYAASPDIQDHVAALRVYLRGGMASQSLFTRALILSADSDLHGVIEPAQRQAVIDELFKVQGADGGWSLTRLSSWQRIDGSKIEDVGDGMATALITLILEDAGVPIGAPPIKAARRWLAAHQDRATGSMPAKSINKDRDPKADAYLFMTDAATGYAALAMMKR